MTPTIREAIGALIAPLWPQWPVPGSGTRHDEAERRRALLQAVLDSALAYEREIESQCALCTEPR